MIVYRIAATKHIQDLSGSGARMYGGRWNHKGVGVVYASESRSLATVEFLVHVSIPYIPANLSIASIEIADRIKPKTISMSVLPDDWRDYPVKSDLMEIGSKWILSNASLMLRVPSSVVEHEFNILINPLHHDMRYVKIIHVEDYSLDKRLL
ncbi:MAG: RES family NAD+ phosphorylase [Nitrospirae bacterium]|nr:RES family NAD+ phosphorylase [Nitrospirota bacterium]